MVNNIRELMLQAGLKPNELAILSGLTTAAIYRILNNTVQSIDIDNLVRICASLDCTIDAVYPTMAMEIEAQREVVLDKRRLL